LGVGADVLEHACNSTKRLIKVMTLLKGILDGLVHVSMSSPGMRTVSYLQHALVLFAMCMVRLLCRADIVFEVGNSMFKGLKSLREELRNLKTGQHPVLLIPDQRRTSEVSSPGIASSSTERLVSVREGISLVADVGTDMLLVVVMKLQVVVGLCCVGRCCEVCFGSVAGLTPIRRGRFNGAVC
jgi:hypothetical protein